jgi:hypothetical protein
MDSFGSRSGQYRRPANVWILAVDAADDEAKVVTATREYLATWTPQDIGALPPEARPGRITSAEDLGDMAYRLSQAHLHFDGDAEHRETLERMMGFFIHAASRAAQLSANVISASPDLEPQ